MHRTLSIGRWPKTVGASDVACSQQVLLTESIGCSGSVRWCESGVPARLQCSLSKGPDTQGASDGVSPVIPRIWQPLCVRVRCVPDASGAHLTASGGLNMTVRDRRAWFKQWTRGCFLSTRRSVPASGGFPAARPVTPYYVQWKSQRLYLFEGVINSCWPAWGSLSWHSSILNILVSLIKHLPLISFID
jgi:hypothetical protein